MKQQQPAKPGVGGGRPALALYHLEYCPYCRRVRDALAGMKLAIELRDVDASQRHADELIAGGGKDQVPCLRIQQPDGAVQWLYESSDIIAYLNSIA